MWVGVCNVEMSVGAAEVWSLNFLFGKLKSSKPQAT